MALLPVIIYVGFAGAPAPSFWAPLDFCPYELGRRGNVFPFSVKSPLILNA